MDIKRLPIGVFDSGMGGLTVLKALRQSLPQESFIYLGDTARLPYGTKSATTVQHYAVQMAKILVERQIKALVIACNTATTAALPHLQSLLSDIPVVGVVAPGAETAARITKNHQIAILATETTIASNAYQLNIQFYLPQAIIHATSASLLVALAEEGMHANIIAKETFKHYLQGMQSEDTLLLGCTHFPVFKPLLATILPSSVAIVDSAEATAKHVQCLLRDRSLLSDGPHQPTQFLVTDSIERFQRVGQMFLGESLHRKQLDMVDA